MTKESLQKELKEKVKEGIKPSDLKKLKRSKSLDDLPTSSPNLPLPKSKSQLEIPLLNQPSLKQQVANLKDELTTERKRVSSLREDLNNSQQRNQQSAKKITQLEDQILQLRLDKIKEFGDYLDKKEDLENELELNVNEGVKEIQRLENQLKTISQQKQKLQTQLTKSSLTSSNLEPSFNYWPLILVTGLTLWLLKNYG